MTLSRRLRDGLIVSLLALLLGGCGPSGPPKVKVSGQLLMNGKPVTLKNPMIGIREIEMQLQPMGDTAQVARGAQTAVVNPATGAFEITGDEGKGLPAGKYRVCVVVYDPRPTDRFNGRFALDKSPVTVTITGADTNLVIDLAKPNG